MVNSITKLSPVKINLYLEVLNKTKSGYHNLESLMTLCDCGDVINIKKDLKEKDILKIVINDSKAKKYLENQKITKTIFVQNKIINYIVTN